MRYASETCGLPFRDNIAVQPHSPNSISNGRSGHAVLIRGDQNAVLRSRPLATKSDIVRADTIC